MKLETALSLKVSYHDVLNADHGVTVVEKVVVAGLKEVNIVLGDRKALRDLVIQALSRNILLLYLTDLEIHRLRLGEQLMLEEQIGGRSFIIFIVPAFSEQGKSDISDSKVSVA